MHPIPPWVALRILHLPRLHDSNQSVVTTIPQIVVLQQGRQVETQNPFVACPVNPPLVLALVGHYPPPLVGVQ